MTDKKTTLFSGIQPTGDLSIGHYLGVIRHWLKLQDEHKCFFAIADLHALTTKHDPKVLRSNIMNLLAWYLAVGLDPKNNILFCQSHVAAHSQLSWILNCNTYMGELNRMTQFKDKSQQFEKNINVGLFAYPVLMAADILLYNTNVVPVGEDQKQHLELARDVAMRFNNQVAPVFNIPEPVIAKQCSRIMSLQDPTKKMSKSDPNQNSAILLSDEPGLIVKKIKRSVTDSESKVSYDPNRAGISNLVSLYSSLTGESYTEIEAKYAGSGYGTFKSDLADLFVATIEPIQKRYNDYKADHEYLNKVMQDGAERANLAASSTLIKVTDALGLVR
jgi:tryptophanyl-tRNA synthetase